MYGDDNGALPRPGGPGPNGLGWGPIPAAVGGTGDLMGGCHVNARNRSRTCRAATAALAALGGLAAVAGGAGPASATPAQTYPISCVSRPTPIPSSTALSDVSDVANGRLLTYTVTSPAVGVTNVNVLLPVGYNPASSRRYPVLYLLHGSGGSYADWANTTTSDGEPQGGNVEALVGDLPIIVVMPDDSPDGSYSDWYGISTQDAATNPQPATPTWATYHIDELVPWVDATFHTQADAAGRIIAGLSSGGGGAAKYAAANPGLFGFVGTFSGAVDGDLVDNTYNWYQIFTALSNSGTPNQLCTFGDPYTTDADNQAYYWHDNDPTYQARNLAGTKLFVASGNGTPTAADANTNPVVLAFEELTEEIVDDMSHHFVAALRQAGLGANVHTDFYGDGVHAWYYWQRDLTAFLHWLEPQLDKPLATPASFSFRTARSTSSAWGWSFRYDSGLSVPNVNTAEEFVYLRHVSLSGFTVAGNGTLEVTTPAGSFTPGSTHDVTVGKRTRATKADAAGQLSFPVAIGPPATAEQLVYPVSGPPAGMPHVAVSISG